MATTKLTLNDLVRKEASKNVGCYNFVRDVNEKERKRTHNKVCKDLVAFADKYNFPMGVLVYVGVSTSAHKPSVFEKGYKKFDLKKAEAVEKLCTIFAEKYGEKYRTKDLLVHACDRYYKLNGGKVKLFKQFVKDMPENFTFKGIDQSKKLAKAIFGDKAIYTNSGYIASV